MAADYSNCTDLGEVLNIEDGKNGFLISPGDYKKIIEIVHQVKTIKICNKGSLNKQRRQLNKIFDGKKPGNTKSLYSSIIKCREV